MRAYVISDTEPTAQRIRDAMLKTGIDCPPRGVMPLGSAADLLAQGFPDLIVLIMPPDPERALSVLAQLNAPSSCPVLAVGPANDSRFVLRALRSGADDYIDETEIDAEFAAALVRLRKNTSTLAAVPARTIALLAPSGGSGSSTLAVNIATALAAKQKSSLLVDLKLQTGDLAALLDLRPSHTLADLCQNIGRLDRVMLEGSLERHSSGVHLLAPARNFAEASAVTPDGVRQVLDFGRSMFPYVVVDLDHSFGPEQIQVLRQADIILMVLRLDFTCLRNAQRSMDHLRQMGINSDHIKVVVNRYGQAKEVPAAKAEEALGVKIFHYVPEDAKAVNRANNNGVPVVLESPSARITKSLIGLAANVNGRHNSH